MEAKEVGITPAARSAVVTEPSVISVEPTEPAFNCRLEKVPLTSPPAVLVVVISSAGFVSPVLEITLPVMLIPVPPV
jgi:hypothetical protein